jgi:hypothetical protein
MPKPFGRRGGKLCFPEPQLSVVVSRSKEVFNYCWGLVSFWIKVARAFEAYLQIIEAGANKAGRCQFPTEHWRALTGSFRSLWCQDALFFSLLTGYGDTNRSNLLNVIIVCFVKKPTNPLIICVY